MLPTFCSYTKALKCNQSDIWKHNTGSPLSSSTTAHSHDFHKSNAKLSLLLCSDTHCLCLGSSLLSVLTFFFCLFAQSLLSLPCKFWVWHRLERQIRTGAWIVIPTIPVAQEAGSMEMANSKPPQQSNHWYTVNPAGSIMFDTVCFSISYKPNTANSGIHC